MTTYKIVRMYIRNYRRTVVKTGLSLEQAQAHCRSPETSSSKAISAQARKRTAQYGPWFDGYDEE